MLVCIRGCGKAGERCFDLLQYEKDMEICFADLDSSKKCAAEKYHHMNESDTRNICGKIKENYYVESYQIEIMGGYLRDYLDRELLQSVQEKQICS